MGLCSTDLQLSQPGQNHDPSLYAYSLRFTALNPAHFPGPLLFTGLIMNTRLIKTAQNFEHKSLLNADGSRLRARRNGATKTWKTRPTEFRIPIKHGMYDYGYITQADHLEWVSV